MDTKGRSTGRILGLLLLLCGLGVGAYFGYRAYEISKLRQSILPDIKGVSLRLARAIEPNGNATWKEIFESREGDIRFVGDSILKVQSVTNDANQRVLQPVTAYMTAGREFLRASLGNSRARFTRTTTLDASVRATTAWVDANSYTEAMLTKIMDEAEAASKEAEAGMIKSEKDLLNAGAVLLQTQASISKGLPMDTLISRTDFQRHFDELTAAMEKRDKDTKDLEEKMRKLNERLAEARKADEAKKKAGAESGR